MNIHLKQFTQAAATVTANRDHTDHLRNATNGYAGVRAGTQARFADWEQARLLASEAKWDAIERLEEHLINFEAQLEARGANVYWASDADEARRYVRKVVRDKGARLIVKSKSMTTEEIHLNQALETDGFEVVESDLGEFIVQLRNEPPYHIVMPAMHLTLEDVSRDFHKYLNEPETTDPEELTMQARRALRETYLNAGIGITGANFAIAETGMISITENEGNARLTASMPPVHIAIVGIEKILPKLSDLALLLPMLATAGTGQHLTAYNSLFAGARMPDEPDGPREFHVVLLDNGRTNLLAQPEQRDALRCIRCGACLNMCPIFRHVGGHSYGTTYQGPIGSVITPHLSGMSDWGHLSAASSLCGACSETCPVKIDLHHHLLANRHAAAQAKKKPVERLLMRGFALTMRRPGAYRLATAIARPMHWVTKPIHGTLLDPLAGWRRTRTFPDPPRETFKTWWRKRGGP